ncbi:hypothetical protein DMENIID0001_041690 [Sergentomyia squamirostris]
MPISRGWRWKTNLDLVSIIFYGLKLGHREAIQEALDLIPVGTSNTFASGMVLAAVGNPSWKMLRELMTKDKTCCYTLSCYKAYFKAVSIAVRRTGRWVDGKSLSIKEVSSIPYFELMSGRAGNVTDWEGEKAKRCGPRVPLVDPFDGKDFLWHLEQELVDLIEKIMPNKDEWGPWTTFVESRQKWVTSGSAGGATYQLDGERIRLNKHCLYETLKTEEVMAWIDSTPELAARGSEKYEAGKARAIYGTAPRDQALTTYVIAPLERKMGRVAGLISGHTGIEEVADIGIRLDAASKDDVECTMLDYADFNYQHTLEAQELLFRVTANKLRRFENPDLNKVAEWCRAAQLNQKVRFPADEQWYQITQGMFSGVRSTDFTNTLLNYAYFMTAKRRVREELGLQPSNLFHLHKGDDVWISNSSRNWAAALYEYMSNAGFAFQPSKQMFDRNRGEFLRVLYTKEGARGYMMRAVATMLIKPLQGIDEISPQGKATAFNSQIHLLFRRGYSLPACELLWWAMIPHALGMRLPKGGGTSIPLHISMKPFSKGGLDLGPPLTVGHAEVTTRPLPAPIPVTKRLEAAFPTYMTDDWIKHVSSKIKDNIDAAKLAKAIHAVNMNDSMTSKDRQLSMRRLEKEYLS